jgi:UPF0755 protein
MKHFLLSFLSLLIIGTAALAVIGGLAVHHYLSDGALEESTIVVIERGNGVSAIAQKLEAEGVISQPVLFKVAGRFGESLKAGEYQFPARVSMAEAIRMMRDGEVFDRKITIPEGYTSYQIVKLLNARDDLEGSISEADVPAEGSLLPNTYHFVGGETPQDIIARMQAAMTKTLDELWEGRADNLPVKTKEEALILASVIEKETGVPKERARVAGVFVNRLKRGIALQTDPTVIYAITKGKIQDEGKGPLGRRLLSKDLQIESPYNTYKNAGLPPGPIANPGRDSIAAALNPEEHDYIFFVADGTGGHVFAKTLAEHNRNVANWRKVRN